MARRVNKKCLKCALLAVEEARQLHGVEGDGCWNDLKCHKRRSHYRHRSERNLKRVVLRQIQGEPNTPETIEFSPSLPPSKHFPVLILYTDHPPHPKQKILVHAVGAELWSGTEPQVRIEPVHSFALSQEQFRALTQQILKKFSEHCNTDEILASFSELIYRDMQYCPIHPCPLHS